MDKLTRLQNVTWGGRKELRGDANSAPKFQPPVTLMWRLTLGRLWRRPMMKAWPFGFRPMARSIAADNRSLSAEALKALRKSEASSWPRQVCSVPVQVIRTRLQDSQKL